MTPLSEKQRATLRLLAEAPATTAEIGRAVGTSKGTGAMLQSLCQQGLVAHVSKSGIRADKSKWRLTDRGLAVAQEKT